ncbi:hypothetical protein TorRG33x02_322660, partial [Trema orientale]
LLSLAWSFGYRLVVCWSGRLELEAKDAVNDPPLTKTTPEPPVTNTEKLQLSLSHPKRNPKRINQPPTSLRKSQIEIT